jgi:2-keto-4-pentenoate hydratase/2-oxohepta-3-ene-1,7-dioic acid hydratase in catechol pathway
MKLVRFRSNRKIRVGVLDGNEIVELKSSLFGNAIYGTQRFPVTRVSLLAPTIPSKIVAVGLNYKDHAKELDMPLPKEPLIFLKPPSSVIGHEQPIEYPRMVRRLDYEAELAVVVKKTAKNISERQARSYILGYTCCNDVTARDLQKRDVQWTRAKSFDTFSPLGPCIETDLDPLNVMIRLYKNGVLKQSSPTTNLIFSPYKLLSFISHIMVLLPGDVIATGTPKGVGPMRRGDCIEITIDGIGTLKNQVALSNKRRL